MILRLYLVCADPDAAGEGLPGGGTRMSAATAAPPVPRASAKATKAPAPNRFLVFIGFLLFMTVLRDH